MTAPSVPGGLYQMLLVIYIAGLMWLAGLSLFISLFYRKRVKLPSPLFSFVSAVGTGMLFLFSFIPMRDEWAPVIGHAQAGLLFACGLTCMYGSLALYFTMKKVPK